MRTGLLGLVCALVVAWPSVSMAQDDFDDPDTTDGSDEGAAVVLTTSTTSTSGVITTGGLAFLLFATRSGGVRRVMLRHYIEHNPQGVHAAAALGGGEAVNDLALILGVKPTRMGAAMRAHRRTITLAMADGHVSDGEAWTLWRALSST